MSGAVSASTIFAGIGAAASIISTVNQSKQAKKAQESQEQAAAQATAASEKQAAQAEQAMNRTNSRRPDTAAMLSANEQVAKGGVGGTMLTGAMGVDPTQLALGRSTLLGS